MKHIKFAALCTALTFAAAAGQAQTNLLANSSFEQWNDAMDNPFGWRDFTNAGELYRRVGDGMGPTFAHTGIASIELASGNNFEAFTSDVFEFDLGGNNNPPVHFPGPDCKVSGWYLIPTGQPLVGTNAGLKLEFRRPNNSIFTAVEHLTISGTTNNEWVYYEFTVTSAEIEAIIANFPPGPVSVSVLALRFGSFSSTGVIFWDDISFSQGCASDFNGDGFVNGDDFDAYVMEFEAGSISADFDHNGFVNGDDFDGYVVAFEAGC